MILNISTLDNPADELGYLLYKHPAKFQSFKLNYCTAHCFYAQVSQERTTFCLLLDTDPMALNKNLALQNFVNDRPYVASSLMSVAIGRTLKSAMKGVCKDRPELGDKEIALQAHLPCIHLAGNPALLKELFQPLGYTVEANPLYLDDIEPGLGNSEILGWRSTYYSLTISATTTVSRMLKLLYVLIPVLDNQKHYYVGKDEVELLMSRASDWLAEHPLKDLIIRRYLAHKSHLTQEAQALLAHADIDPQKFEEQSKKASSEDILEKPLSLNQKRLDAVLVQIQAITNGARFKLIDLGCGEGKLLNLIVERYRHSLDRLAGLDATVSILERANRTLTRKHPNQDWQLDLMHGSLTYRDRRISGFDIATCIEVIEHIDESRLDAFASNLFGAARPKTVIVTTPNREYNVLFAGLNPNQMRHADHRFEWTRKEFSAWTDKICKIYGYSCSIKPVGDVDTTYGAPTQMAVFVSQKV